MSQITFDPTAAQGSPLFKCLMHGTCIPGYEQLHYQRDVHIASCPHCETPCCRRREFQRQVWDLTDPPRLGPRLLKVSYSQHFCRECESYFTASVSDLGLTKCQYTNRVIMLVLSYMKTQQLSYRDTSLAVCRRHGLCIPFATIRNWSKKPPLMLQ
jgi:hypothetical protein